LLTTFDLPSPAVIGDDTSLAKSGNRSSALRRASATTEARRYRQKSAGRSYFCAMPPGFSKWLAVHQALRMRLGKSFNNKTKVIFPPPSHHALSEDLVPLAVQDQQRLLWLARRQARPERGCQGR
jgi:hypothetical protein